METPTDKGYTTRATFYRVEDDTDVDRQFWTKIVQDIQPTSILELPCGIGRNIEWLAPLCNSLWLVDKNPAIVAELSKIVRKSPLQKRIKIVCQDATKLDLGSRFSFIMVPREGLQLLERNKIVTFLERLKRHLLPNGTVVVDAASFNAGYDICEECPQYYNPRTPQGEVVLDFERHMGHGHMLTRRHRWFSEGTQIRFLFEYTISKSRPFRSTQTMCATMVIQTYELSELESIVATAGFSVPRVCFNYGYTPDSHGCRQILFLTH